jgi:hypothetical protein
MIFTLNAVAWTQTESGSIVIVMATRHGPVAAAADSLAYNRNADTYQSCKIATVGNKLIVAATGYAGKRSGGKGQAFALASAQEVFGRFSKKQIALKTFGSDFFSAWIKEVAHYVNVQLAEQPKLTSSLQDPRVTALILIGLNENGLVTTWSGHLQLSRNSKGVSVCAIHDHIYTDRPYNVFIGKTSVAEEAAQPTTPQGQRWNDQIHALADPHPNEELSKIWTRQLVQFTIDNLPQETIGTKQIKVVGPPIDSITMDSSGNIMWGDHKPECN